MRFDVAVIGGGIVGLATAYHLTGSTGRRRVVVIEKEEELATHQTGRNSGVIHSGVYYRPGSLKARNCREGRLALIDFCESQNISFEICGKVIVAVEEAEFPALRRIYQRGQENGVACRMIDRAELRELEPHCSGLEAIHVPEAGIISFRDVALRLAEILRERGAVFRMSSRAVGFREGASSITVETSTGELEADVVVNCAGLYSDTIARLSGADVDVQIVPFRGEYYQLKERARHFCRNLIYPVPDPEYPFLGMHFTRMLDGRVECGPSAVLAFAREGYSLRTLDVGELFVSLRFKGFRRLAGSHWRKGIDEVVQSLSRRYYLRSLKRLIPEMR
ncbi:MAG: L-2-hydroxyglutarate oxidase, partial [Rhodothermales bacterium]|nr:L-2-hydroxyglutarate oxidase [Rhodothermales bacterium]